MGADGHLAQVELPRPAPLPAPRVAIIMSVHLTVPLEFVREALESVLTQTYPSVHAFVMCDGPVRPDVREYLDGLDRERVRLLASDENRGLPAALNELIDVVTESKRYEFLARMDADDVCEPNRIERQVDFMEANPEVGVVGTWCREMDEAGRPLFLKKLPTDHDEMIRFMAVRCPLVHPSVLARTSVFSRGIRYDPTLRQAQDYDLWSRLAHSGVRLANVPEPLLRFRVDARFYSRRGGWGRAAREARLKYQHLVRFRLRSPRNLLGLGAMIVLRMAPPWAKKLAYRWFR